MTTHEILPDITRYSPERPSEPDILFETKRSGLASFPSAILRSSHAKWIAVNVNLIALQFLFRLTAIPSIDLRAVDVRNGYRWASITLRHFAGGAAVSVLNGRMHEL